MTKNIIAAALVCVSIAVTLAGCASTTPETARQGTTQTTVPPLPQAPSSTSPNSTPAPEPTSPTWAAALEADPSLRHLSAEEPASSRTVGEFTLLSFTGTSNGEGLLVLLRSSAEGMLVVDAGTAWVGCGLVPPKTARSLELLCG